LKNIIHYLINSKNALCGKKKERGAARTEKAKDENVYVYRGCQQATVVSITHGRADDAYMAHICICGETQPQARQEAQMARSALLHWCRIQGMPLEQIERELFPGSTLFEQERYPSAIAAALVLLAKLDTWQEANG
jgi:hypothetical protein